MALQSSGAISFGNISSEFGVTNGTSVRFGAYRVSQTVSGLENLPLDAGIPQSGTIKVSDFYNKKLNVVVDYTSGSVATRVNARTDYANNNNVVVVGNFRQRPVSPAGTKIWVHTNGDLGSNIKSTTREYCSLITGSWDTTTDLRVDIGPNGRIFGAGGDGGNGGNGGSNGVGSRNSVFANPGANGKNGTSAIGINYTPIIITNRGTIQSGGGGAGGGGGAYGLNENTGTDDNTYGAGGGGGGGGIGYPGGTGGLGGVASGTSGNAQGIPGASGTIISSGNGGNGSGSSGSWALGGGGGGGGTSGLGGVAASANNGQSSGAGTNGSTTVGGDGGYGWLNSRFDGPNRQGPGGGTGGASGYAIVVNNDGTGVTITNTGTIVGNTVYSTIPV